jgi:flagellar hook-length control protein FliK
MEISVKEAIKPQPSQPANPIKAGSETNPANIVNASTPATGTAEVASTAKPDVQVGEVLSQVAEGVAKMDKSRQPVLHLQLHPENLGKIDLRMTVRTDGLHVALNASATDTGTLLERYLPELRQSLTDAGVHLAGLAVNGGATQRGGTNGQPWRSRNAAQKPASLPGLEIEANGAESGLSRASTSGHDYRI